MTMIQPSSVEDLAALIGDAARDGTQVFAVGGGTHGAGGDTGHGQRVSLSGRVRSVVTYDPAELVATVDAGLAVEELDAMLAEHGQEWCADIVPGSTVGGAIASGASSLRRFAIGPLRDSVLGLELVDGRGRVIRVGGRTVKNSTGLDLVRLIVGSRGTLGVITRAHLRVRPRPRVRLVVRASDVDLRSAIAAARQAGVLAAAIADGSSVQFLLEGWRDDVASDAAMLEERLGGEIDDCSDPFPTERPWASWPAVALLTVRPSALEMLVARSGDRWATLLSTGHLWVGGDSPSDLIPVCRAAVESGGHATLVSQPGWPTLRESAAEGEGEGIGGRVKAAFDPEGVFPRLARWSPA
jgi:glycolate oxidase FAD binding subunit